MTLTDLRNTLADTRLRLPVAGKTYIVEKASAATFLWLQTVWPDDDGVIPQKAHDSSELEVFQRVLGPAFQEMLDDGLSLDEIRVCGITALMDVRYGRTAAVAHWQSGGALGNPDAPKLTTEQMLSAIGAARESMHLAAPTGTAPDADPSTPSPESPSTAPKTAKTKTPRASRGRGSSPTGT